MAFLAQARDGKLDFGSKFNLARLRDTLKKKEGKYFRLEEQESLRTTQQNRFYWFYLGIVERETGNLAKDIHEWAKREFLPPEYIKINVGGKIIERKIPASTTKLKKIPFGEYLDKISAITEVAIPDPETEMAKFREDEAVFLEETK